MVWLDLVNSFFKGKVFRKNEGMLLFNSCSVVQNPMFPLSKRKKLTQPICPYKLPIV